MFPSLLCHTAEEYKCLHLLKLLVNNNIQAVRLNVIVDFQFVLLFMILWLG